MVSIAHDNVYSYSQVKGVASVNQTVEFVSKFLWILFLPCILQDVWLQLCKSLKSEQSLKSFVLFVLSSTSHGWTFTAVVNCIIWISIEHVCLSIVKKPETMVANYNQDHNNLAILWFFSKHHEQCKCWTIYRKYCMFFVDFSGLVPRLFCENWN